MVDFSLLQTPNFLATATGAFEAGQKQAQQRNRQNALAQYETDPRGALNALMRNGDIQTAGQLQNYEADQSQARYRDQQQQWQTQQQDRQKKVWGQQDQDWMREGGLRAAMSFYELPEAQWTDHYRTTVAPALIDMGYPKEAVDQVLADGHLTRDELDQFVVQQGGQVPQPKYQNFGGSVVEIGPDGRMVMGPDAKPKVVFQDPEADLDRQYRRAQIDATKALGTQREASAARALRPAAGRALSSRTVVSGGQVTRRLGPTLSPDDGW